MALRLDGSGPRCDPGWSHGYAEPLRHFIRSCPAFPWNQGNQSQEDLRKCLVYRIVCQLRRLLGGKQWTQVGQESGSVELGEHSLLGLGSGDRCLCLLKVLAETFDDPILVEIIEYVERVG